MPGDGIGQIVLPEAIRVLDAVGFAADYVHADIGWELWIDEGNPLPERTVDLLAEHGLGLFGAITSKPKNEAAAELNPDLQGRDLVYYSPIVGLRQRFNLDVSIRPCRSFPGNPLNFIRRTADGGWEEPNVDAVIFRQNTEGLYGGVEWTDPPDFVRAALKQHPKFKRLVTVCEKPNVLRETSGMMEEEARRVKADYPDIQLWSTNIDAQMMWLTKNPEDYSVIVAGNMFGDIVSDAFAGLVGGLGFACSANIGDEVAVFEPTHGSAPKYADLMPSIVNPIAMVLTAAMLLDHIGEIDRAEALRKAVAAVVNQGEVRAYDMLRLPGGADVLSRGAASTTEITDAIISKLG
jgi:3-isopropylmalate dehydrogenase